jgi:DedD protein
MDTKLVQRLLGGSVLIALAIIVLGLIARSPRQQTMPDLAPLTDQPAAQTPATLSERTEPVDNSAEDEEVALDWSPATVPEDAVLNEGLAPPSARVQQASSPARRPSAVPHGSTQRPVIRAQKLWVVQLGVFSKPQHAARLIHKLKSQRFQAYTHTVSRQGRTLIQVRVGPESNVQKARGLRARLLRRIKINGIVVSTHASPT